MVPSPISHSNREPICKMILQHLLNTPGYANLETF
jgi:hypothetical protein